MRPGLRNVPQPFLSMKAVDSGPPLDRLDTHTQGTGDGGGGFAALQPGHGRNSAGL